MIQIMPDCMAQKIEFLIAGDHEPAKKSIQVRSLVIAGWAGRDRNALEEHIAELEREGIPRPVQTPEFYRIGVNLLTTAVGIQVTGDTSTGEIEAFMLKAEDELWVGVGSDHTDRKLEATSVVMSKQACPKPIGTTLWRYSDIRDHWDAIEVCSYRYEDGERIVYQRGKLSANLPGNELLDRFAHDHGPVANGTLMFCGTIPAEGGIKFSKRFEMELHDPIRDLYIRHAYDIFTLAVN
jgi:hypothetical protein